MPEPELGLEPSELTDPVDVVAWLRALTPGTVLLDNMGDAWQLNENSTGHSDSFLAWNCTTDSHVFRLDSATDMATMAAWRPFRVLWTLPGGDGS